MQLNAQKPFKVCKQYLLDHVSEFKHVTAEDIEAIRPDISKSDTLSTLHGCPPQEIERIATYLLTEKKLNTFIKCNPTLLGYELAETLDKSMGYDYIAFGRFHFEDDLQYVVCCSDYAATDQIIRRNGSGIWCEDYKYIPCRC